MVYQVPHILPFGDRSAERARPDDLLEAAMFVGENLASGIERRGVTGKILLAVLAGLDAELHSLEATHFLWDHGDLGNAKRRFQRRGPRSRISEFQCHDSNSYR